MSIVVATDFSPCSQTAVRLGAALARRQRVPLLLVHVVEPPALDVPTVPMGSTGWERDLAMAAEIGIARDASEARQRGVAVETRVLFGTVASTILEAAAAQRADLIVVGSHGSKHGAHLFLGSVAESIVRSAACPILATRATDGELTRWEGAVPLRLAVGTDGSAASQAALVWAGGFARSQACELSIVRLYWPPEEAVRYGLHDPWDGPRRDSELLPLLERDLRRDAQAQVGMTPERLRLRAAGRDAADVLADEAGSLGADALVIGVPRHRPARWTVLTPGPVLRSSALPVLCVPEGRAAARPQPKQVRSVLIATDLSDSSNQVVTPAYGLLLPAGGRVELCTVHAVGAADTVAVPVESPLGDEERTKLESRLRALVPPEVESAGITTNVSIIEARFAAEAILAAAQRLDVDLIAVASHGRSGIKRAVLGSVAEEVARRSARPVLIVRSRST